MPHILNVISSPRGEASNSRQLGNAIIEQLVKQHPGATVTERNVASHHFPYLEEVYLGAFFAPAEHRSPEQATAVRNAEEVIAELQAADILVIDAPMYNFSIPAGLKAYFDHLARAGVTFRYTAAGSEGLLLHKKAYLAVASGNIYSNSGLQHLDFVVPYITAFLGFLGITDVTAFRVEGIGIPGVKETALTRAIEQARTALPA